MECIDPSRRRHGDPPQNLLLNRPVPENHSTGAVDPMIWGPR